MKRNLFFSILVLLLSMTAQSATAGDGPQLRIDSINVFGNRLAMLAQQVEMGVENLSAADFEGKVHLLARDKTTGRQTFHADTLLTIGGQRGMGLVMYCQLPKGCHELTIAIDEEGRQQLCTTEVDIAPLRPLHINAEVTLDMLSEEADGNVLYGSRIRGRVTVKSEDAAYYGIDGGKAEDDGILLWVDDEDSGEERYLCHVSDILDSYGRVTAVFCHDAVFHDGGRMVLKVGYAVPGAREVIDSIHFTMRSGTNTYWTADGQVLPLPMNEAQQLVVPAEAVAVDLRCQPAPGSVAGYDATLANPNCLYYLDLLADVPQGLDDSRNLIRGLQAQTIRLVEGHDYYCPLAFHAQLISYLMTPSYDSQDDALCGRGYSETIVLPFSPTHASLYDVNAEDGGMIHGDMLKVLHVSTDCHSDTLTVSELFSVREMKPYVPYVLGVYIGSSLLFTGEETPVPTTREAIVMGTAFSFIGTTVSRRLPAGTFVYHAAAGTFLPTEDELSIMPFRAYICAQDDYDQFCLSDNAWGTKGNPTDATAINDVATSATRAGNATTVHDLCGRPVVAVSQHLPRGIYIVGGRKMIAR